MSNDTKDTIAALATPVGVGGIGLIRISGSSAVAVADKIFRTPSGAKLCSAKSHSIHYGHVTDPETGAKIDEAMAAVMRAPRTFTAEDVVEISTHGSPAVLQKTLFLLLGAGARMAQAGEFTKRAFLNGRVDLARAEAVLDVIHADSDAALGNAISQLEGGLSYEIEQIRAPLLYAQAQFAAAADYPDDDIADLTRSELHTMLCGAFSACKKLLDSAHSGTIAKQGLRCVLAGKPNAGKSSLLNALTCSQRAIVTHVAGTTRDVIEESISIDGVNVRLFDTAGVRSTNDPVEKIGVDRSINCIEGADLVLVVIDASNSLTEEDFQIISQTEHKQRIFVFNKSDLPAKCAPTDITAAANAPVTNVSAVTGAGLEALKHQIEQLCSLGGICAAGTLVSNLRHIEALSSAKSSLKSALDALCGGMPLDMCSIDISAALESLGLITGAGVSADIVDEIFAHFCVGK